MSAQYQGKFVFVEAVITDPAKQSTYNNGEYFCVRQTPGTLYCTKLGDVYSLHNTTQFPLIGSSSRYTVVDSWRDDDRVREQLRTAKTEIDDVRSGRKKESWVSYVYSNATAVIASIERGLAPASVAVHVGDRSVLDVSVPAGVKQIRLNFE